VASSYGLSLLLYENAEENTEDIVRLSHGCLLVLIETRDDPALFNVPEFVLRLQRITNISSIMREVHSRKNTILLL
jgi:hypothetical protein